MPRSVLPMILLLTLLASGLSAGLAAGATIDPELLSVMQSKASGAQTEALLFVDAPFDLAALDASLSGVGWRERQLRVMQAFEAHATATQTAALRVLRAAEAQGRASRIRTLWTVNGVAFHATSDVIQSVAQVTARGALMYDKRYDMLSGVTAPHPVAADQGDGSAPSSGGAPVQPNVPVVAWSVSWINAPAVWALGYDGTGVLVAGMDTGVWLAHPDIAGQMWVNPGEIAGNAVDDDGNGYIDDVNGYDFGDNDSSPNDEVTGNGANHGTHTAGTVAGDGTNGTSTGVAPNCRFMSCKVFPNSGAGATFADIYEAHQYAIRMGARVFTESLGVEGIIPPSFLRAARLDADVVRVAGVTYFNSAGNYAATEVPPDELGMTARVPAPWNANGAVPWSSLGGVVSVGGTGYKNDLVYSGSSNGPATWQAVGPFNDWPMPTGLVKPDVAAPGVQVNSLQKPASYSGDTWTGTSMSCPHAAGVAALMLNKNPALTPADIDRILEQSAVDLGAAGKDNVFGSGRIDALAAVNAVPATQLPYVVQTAVSVTEPSGNGYIDPGETVGLVIELTNNSKVVNATVVAASLSLAANPYVTVLDGNSNYPNLAAGGGNADNAADPFSLSVSGSTPQGFLIPLLLNITTAEGYSVTIDSKVEVGLPDFLTHDVGQVFCTMTDSGILGFTDSDHTYGDGFGPITGATSLYIGSLWLGQTATWVCNHDYPGMVATPEANEFRTVSSPNGRMLKLTPPKSDQDFQAIFNDSGHATPKGIVITQTSYAFDDPGYNEFVMITYKVRNDGVTTITAPGVHAGIFCDFDINDGNNLGGVDNARHLTYMNAGPGVSDGPFFGIQLIFPSTHRNLMLINNSTYVYPEGRINDSNKARFLRGLLTNTIAGTATDWSAMTSAGPYDLAPGQQQEFTFALVYGATQTALLNNADAAVTRYSWLQAADVEDLPPGARPVTLFQNSPNPFNPSTTIRFAVAHDGPVRLDVYDLAGRKVKTLENRVLAPGQWTVHWDGTDETGKSLASGMYLYTLESDGKKITKKMTLVK